MKLFIDLRGGWLPDFPAGRYVFNNVTAWSIKANCGDFPDMLSARKVMTIASEEHGGLVDLYLQDILFLQAESQFMRAKQFIERYPAQASPLRPNGL